jgi:hypothetical protein
MRRLSAERQRTSGCRRRCHAPPLSGGSQAAPVALAWDQAHRKAVLRTEVRPSGTGQTPARWLPSASSKLILLAKSFGLGRWGSCHQPCERCDAGFGTPSLKEPLAKSEHVQPHCRQQMSQMDPREAHVAGPSQAEAPCPTRDGAFNPGTAGILRLKRLCGFPLPGCLEGLILRLGPDGERPPGVTLLRADALT